MHDYCTTTCICACARICTCVCTCKCMCYVLFLYVHMKPPSCLPESACLSPCPTGAWCLDVCTLLPVCTCISVLLRTHVIGTERPRGGRALYVLPYAICRYGAPSRRRHAIRRGPSWGRRWRCSTRRSMPRCRGRRRRRRAAGRRDSHSYSKIAIEACEGLVRCPSPSPHEHD